MYKLIKYLNDNERKYKNVKNRFMLPFKKKVKKN